MATNIRRKKRVLFKKADLPPENDLEYILHGYCMLDGDKPSASDADLWAKYGKSIMALQGQPCGDLVPWHAHKKTFFDYFERPALWWLCGRGAEEPRRLIAGDPSVAMPELGMFFGVPKKYLSEADYKSLTFESVRDYLIRRELLTPAEKAILEKA